MQVVNQASLHPYCCFLCTKTTGQMIDTGVRGRFMNNSSVGALYICVDNCARGLLRAIGAHTGPEFDALGGEKEKLRLENVQLRADLKKQAPLIEGIARTIAEQTPPARTPA